jgi:outer membrane receptor protein involved in Fe transport
VRRALVVGATIAISPIVAGHAADVSESISEVIVTGTRIARPNLESSVPITTVQGEDLYKTGNTAMGDLLNDLPALRSTFSQSNSSRFLGTAGLNLLDLRGLGTPRTLVLVNGRRHVAADILGNGTSPDVNTFPTDLVERIDVVTGGNSAVYGSDAIAGVVNFVLKRDFAGLQVRAQGGNTAKGDGGDHYVSALWGTNFLDDRGNLAANFEYATQEAFFASDRSNLRHVQNFVLEDSDPAGSPNGSDGIPDRNFYRDIRSASLSNGGTWLGPAAAAAPCGLDRQGAPFACAFLFQPDGTLIPQTGTRIGQGPIGNFDGGNGISGREGKALAIFPDLQRASLNVFGHLTIDEAFEPFVEAKYVRTESTNYNPPAFFTGSTIGGGLDLRERPTFDNPFLSDAARSQINQARAAAGAGPLAGSTRFVLRRNLLDLGLRQEEATRETSRVVLGVGGRFADEWSYEVAVNYGKFEEETEVLGNLNTQRFLLAMDATRDASGNIVCRSRIDPSAAIGLDAQLLPSPAAFEFAQSRLAQDVAACVPMNPFGQGGITPQMRNYLVQDTTSVAEISQLVTSATISGSSKQWFELPAGPIGVAFGLEQRTEENSFKAEDLVEQGMTFYNALPAVNAPKFKVNEAFAELRVPLLANQTLADQLTVNLAGRYADYAGKTGSVFAHNYGLEWAPLESLRLRVSKARAVRAPALLELYAALGQNFAFPLADPCAARNIGTGSPNRVANCTAAGIPASFDFVYTSSLGHVSGGNPALKEETSDSLTAGLVFQPTFLPGLSLSFDYFDIDIEDVITAPTAQAILNACYDSASLNNQFCGLFQRAGVQGAPSGEEPFQILEGSLQQVQVNYASSTARGFDVEVAYSHELGSLGQLGTRLVYSHALEREDFLDPTDPSRPDQFLLELGDPKDAFNLATDFTRGPFSINHEVRFVGKMLVSLAEDFFSVGGRPPQNADFADRRYYPSAVYHDLRASYDISDALNVYLGVDNLADKVPPLGLTGTGGGSAIYEPRGRFFFAGAKYNFGGPGR